MKITVEYDSDSRTVTVKSDAAPDQHLVNVHFSMNKGIDEKVGEDGFITHIDNGHREISFSGVVKQS